MQEHDVRMQFLEEMGAPAHALAMSHMQVWHHVRQSRALAGESYLSFCKMAQLEPTQAQGLLPELRDMLALDEFLPEPLRIRPVDRPPDAKPGVQATPLESLTGPPWTVEALTPWITSKMSFTKALEIADHPRRWAEATPQMTILGCDDLPRDGALWRKRLTKRTDFGTPLASDLVSVETIDITAEGFTDDGSGFRRYSYVLHSSDPVQSSLAVLEDTGWIELSGDARGTQLRIQKRASTARLADDGLRAIVAAGFSAELWMWATGFFIASGQVVRPPVPVHRPVSNVTTTRPAGNEATVAVLGAGPAGLACAWLLSNPTGPDQKKAWTGDVQVKVELFDQASQPGGKAASVRVKDPVDGSDRIEEHGLHVLMGCYANLLEILRWCRRPGDAELLVDSAVMRIPIDTPPDPARTWKLEFKPWAARDLLHGDTLRVLLDQLIEAWRNFLHDPTRMEDAEAQVSPFIGQMLDFIQALHAPSNEPRPLMRAVLAMTRQVVRRSPSQGSVKNSRDFLTVAMHWSAQLSLCAELRTGWKTAATNPDDVDDDSPFEQLGPLARLLRAIGRAALPQGKGTEADRFAAELVELGTTLIAGLDDAGLFPAWAVADPKQIGRGPYADWVLSLQGLDELSLTEWLERSGIAKGFAGRSRVLAAVTAGLFTTPDRIGAGTFINGFSRLVFTYDKAPGKRMKGGTSEAVIAPIVRTLNASPQVDIHMDTSVLSLNGAGEGRVTSVNVQARTGAGAASPETVTADYVVLAIPPFDGPVGGLPAALGESLAAIGSRATIGLQHWSAGDPRYPGAILSGLSGPLRCAAAMDQLAGDEGPGYLHAPVYYCGDIDDADVPQWTAQHAQAWLAANASPFQAGIEAHAPFLSCNHAGSQRYVSADPQTQAARRYGNQTGVSNLVLAGDWTRTALSCGSIEAAVTSGLEAARGILESLGCSVQEFNFSGSLLYSPNDRSTP